MKQLCLFLIVAFVLTGCAKTTETPKTNTAPPVAASNATSTTTSTANTAPVVPLESEYTDLTEKSCKETKPEADSGAIYMAKCPGIGGYKVTTSASDHSQSLEIVDPSGKETLLNLRNVVNTVADFMLDKKIEWRSSGKGTAAKPAAIIFRINVFKFKGDPSVSDETKTESHLAVAKLTNGGPCVTDLVAPSVPDQNVRACELSDSASGRPCMDNPK